MSAQKELADLMAVKVSHNETTNGQLWTIQAAVFIRDHGPAIAELIDACGEYLASKGYSCTRERMLIAHEKLTEPKA
jgi:hypothetical protein